MTLTLGTARRDLADGESPYGDYAIAVDSTSVYWTGGDSVMKVPLDGGSARTLASGVPGIRIAAIAVDTTSVYWTYSTFAPGHPSDGPVMKVPVGGGSPTQLATTRFTSSLDTTTAIAVDSTSVYWSSSSDGTVMKVPVDGGTPTTLASGQAHPNAVAVDAASVYWNNADGTVMKVPLAGGVPTMLATATQGQLSMFIAVDRTSVYCLWGNIVALAPVLRDETIVKVPLAGGSPVTIASGSDLSPYGIAVDGISVYWTNYYGSTLRKVPIGGGPSVTLVADQPATRAIAVDATSVYWVNTADGRVMKLTPK